MLKWATPGQKGFTNALRVKYKCDYKVPRSTQVDSYGGSSRYSSGHGSYSVASSSRVSASQKAKLEAERIAFQKAEELKNIIKGFESVDDESRRASLLDSLCSKEDILTLPLHENPPGKANGLRTDLMRHQVGSVEFALRCELRY